MPIGPLSHTTICLKSNTSSIHSDQRANCGSGPPPPQQQQQHPPGTRSRYHSGNDRFKIAAITSLDGNGKPASFGTPVSVMETNWGSMGLSLDTIVMRGYTEGGDRQHPSADVTLQPLSGVFLKCSLPVSRPLLS